jgi:hypothetical protein
LAILDLRGGYGARINQASGGLLARERLADPGELECQLQRVAEDAEALDVCYSNGGGPASQDVDGWHEPLEDAKLPR